MILIRPSFEILDIMCTDYVHGGNFALEHIEHAGRICYKTEDKMNAGSAKKFVAKILERGHESVIEHSAMTVKFIIDRGVSHELVRHRLCAFSQESTRYCNYKGGVTFVIPPWIDNLRPSEYDSLEIWDKWLEQEDTGQFGYESIWLSHMAHCEIWYKALLKGTLPWSPQQARSVLPNSTKTEIVVTANFREWRHIFRLRCAKAAHPQMREIMIPLHKECKEIIPVIFDDIEY